MVLNEGSQLLHYEHSQCRYLHSRGLLSHFRLQFALQWSRSLVYRVLIAELLLCKGGTDVFYVKIAGPVAVSAGGGLTIISLVSKVLLVVPVTASKAAAVEPIVSRAAVKRILVEPIVL